MALVVTVAEVLLLKVADDARWSKEILMVLPSTSGLLYGACLALLVRWWSPAYMVLFGCTLLILAALKVPPFYSTFGTLGTTVICIMVLTPAALCFICVQLGLRLIRWLRGRTKR